MQISQEYSQSAQPWLYHLIIRVPTPWSISVKSAAFEIQIFRLSAEEMQKFLFQNFWFGYSNRYFYTQNGDHKIQCFTCELDFRIKAGNQTGRNSELFEHLRVWLLLSKQMA